VAFLSVESSVRRRETAAGDGGPAVASISPASTARSRETLTVPGIERPGMDTSPPFENPRARYAVGLGSAAILVALAFLVLEGTVRWIVLGLAVVEVLIVPQLLKLRADRDAPRRGRS
jgi:hypothetical protein